MSEPVTQLLSAFDALAPSDQYEVTAALLRRTLEVPGEISDDALVAIADEAFCTLDTDEEADGNGNA
jgi:hypothetical protein